MPPSFEDRQGNDRNSLFKNQAILLTVWPIVGKDSVWPCCLSSWAGLAYYTGVVFEGRTPLCTRVTKSGSLSCACDGFAFLKVSTVPVFCALFAVVAGLKLSANFCIVESKPTFGIRYDRLLTLYGSPKEASKSLDLHASRQSQENTPPVTNANE